MPIPSHDICFFGVFDGHGGNNCAKFVANSLPTLLCELEMRNNIDKRAPFSNDNVIEQAFLSLDKQYLESDTDSSGSTATTCIIRKFDNILELICINLGDSRTVLHNGIETIPLSVDHKPDTPSERKRIKRAGGYVRDGRVLGELSVSRAFGDSDLKFWEDADLRDIPVTSLPDITRTIIKLGDGSWKFLCLACDGVWDVCSNDEIMNLILEKLKSGVDLLKIAKDVVKFAIENGSDDNVSVIIIVLE